MIRSAEDLQRWLADCAERNYAAFSAKLMPDVRREVAGVRIPALRRTAKELARTDARRALDEWLGDRWHEETLLRGLVTGYARWDWDEWTARTAAFADTIDNWATCDVPANTLTLIRHHRGEGWTFLAPYLESGAEYRQRFGLVMLLSHYMTDEEAERVIETAATLAPAGYYAAMAAGWTLQAAFARWPERVFPLLTAPRTHKECARLARKKIMESLRTPSEWRERVKTLKL